MSVDDLDALQKKIRADALRNGEVSAEQVAILRSQFHYMQVFGAGGEALDRPNLIELPSSGWDAIFYGDALTTSLGFYQYCSSPLVRAPEEYIASDVLVFDSGAVLDPSDSASDAADEQGEGEVQLYPGRGGTVINQAWNTGKDIIDIAHRSGWESVHVISDDAENNLTSPVIQLSLVYHGKQSLSYGGEERRQMPVTGVELTDRQKKNLLVMSRYDKAIAKQQGHQRPEL